MTWLDDEQQHLWRRWLLLTTRLPAALNRQLQADSDLSLADFDVLVKLSETDGGRVRASCARRWAGRRAGCPTT